MAYKVMAGHRKTRAVIILQHLNSEYLILGNT
jgi:hypothetical protein